MQKRSAAAELARKQNHVFVHGTEAGRGGGIIVDRGGGRKGRVYKRARAQRFNYDRSTGFALDKYRSGAEIRRLVSLASWSRGLLASDTFDSSNRFVTGRNPDLDEVCDAARANPPHPGEGAEISKRRGRDSARVVEVEVWIDRSESALIGRDSITIDSTKGRGGGREG